MQRRAAKRPTPKPTRRESAPPPPRPASRDEGSYRGRGNYQGQGNGKPKRFRVTGMWQSRNNTELFTGRLESDRIEELQQLCEKCLNGTGKMVFFMYENTRKRGPRDAEFTIYADEGQEYQGRGSGGGRGSYRGGNGNGGGYRSRQIEQDDQGGEYEDGDDRF